MEELDLRQLMRIAQRRSWVVVVLMLVAGAAAYIDSSRETPVYAASATMIVNPGVSTDLNEYNTVFETQQIAETYGELVVTGPVLDRVAARVGGPSLESRVSASASEESQFLSVRVTDTDPERAVLVANTVVEEFEAYIAERATSRAEAVKGGLNTQVASLTARLGDIDAELAALRAGDNADEPGVQQEISDLAQERSTVTQSLTSLNTSAVTIDAQILAGSAQVEVVDPARGADQVSPNPPMALLLGLFVGLMIGVAVVALLEFLDNTVKPEQHLHELTGAPVLATVSAINKLAPGGDQVFSMTQPRSSAAEAMRLLRTNLEFASASGEIHSLTVTSPGPGEGKSTISANMGVVLAQAGLAVAIVDADLRKPTQHQIFSVANERGLTTLLTHPEAEWRSVALKVALPGLLLVPSGPLPPNPSDLVSGGRFAELLDRIKAEVDVVLIDSPPILSASDSLAIAARTDGVVLVCRSHKTRTDALRHAAHAVHQGGIRLVGLVVNRQQGQRAASYYGQYYGSKATQGD